MTDRRRWVYFSPSWQELVELEDRTPETSGGPAVDRTTQQFWGLRNVNDAILRRCDTNADGEWDGGDEEGGSGGGTYYQLTDSLFSVIAHVRSWSGDVLCRFSYDSYGKVKVHLPTDFNGDGLVNSWDLDAFTAAYASEAGGEGLSADFTCDGVVNADDEELFIKYWNVQQETDTGLGSTSPWGPASLRIGYAGYSRDTVTGRWLSRHRWYDADLGRWITRDPAGYTDGLSMYLYVHGNPFSLVDPTGLSGWPGLSTLLDWSYNRNAKLCQQVSDAGYPGVAKGLNTIQGAQHGLLRNPVGFVDGIYQAGAEVVGGLSTDVGLMSPQTYNEHSIIAPVVNSVADHGIAGTAAGMWQGAKDFGGKLASGDLDAWGDMSFAVGTGAVTAIKAPKVLETLSLIKKVESSEEVAKDVTNALKAVEGGTGAAGETHGPFFNGRGGRYDVLETGGGIERDHVPSQSTLRALGIDTDEGPARQLIRPDHWETPTWGRGAGPDAARAAELDLAKAGNWRQLYANSIKDLRKKTGSLYNSANKEMLEYAKQWKDLKKKEN